MPSDDPKPTRRKLGLIVWGLLLAGGLGIALVMVIGKWIQSPETMGWRDWKFIAGLLTVIVLGGGYVLVQVIRGRSAQSRNDYEKWR